MAITCTELVCSSCGWKDRIVCATREERLEKDKSYCPECHKPLKKLWQFYST